MPPCRHRRQPDAKYRMLFSLNRLPQHDDSLTRHVSRMRWHHGKPPGRSKRRTAVRNSVLWGLTLLLAGCLMLPLFS